MFDEYVKKILEDCGMMGAGSVLGGSGVGAGSLVNGDTYAPGDSRIPKVIGPMLRRLKKRRKHKKRL